jgi:putative Holliday junction resolvase
MDTTNTIKVLLGFDFGMKRIGVAVGQCITQSARPLETLSAKAGTPNWDMVDKLIQKWRPDALVVGIPLNMDGTDQPITSNAKTFAAALQARYELTLFEMDERLTTKDARERVFHAGGYKALQAESIDSVAAQLILQNWFAIYSK